MNRFEVGRPGKYPPEIEELIAKHHGLKNVPLVKAIKDGKEVELTVEEAMIAYCKENPDEVTEDEFEEVAVNYLLGRGHGQPTKKSAN